MVLNDGDFGQPNKLISHLHLQTFFEFSYWIIHWKDQCQPRSWPSGLSWSHIQINLNIVFLLGLLLPSFDPIFISYHTHLQSQEHSSHLQSPFIKSSAHAWGRHFYSSHSSPNLPDFSNDSLSRIKSLHLFSSKLFTDFNLWFVFHLLLIDSAYLLPALINIFLKTYHIVLFVKVLEKLFYFPLSNVSFWLHFYIVGSVACQT